MRQFVGGRLLITAGFVVFIAVKLLMIVGQTAIMGMPRLGDDAYTHIWRATQIDQIGLMGALHGKGDAAYRSSADMLSLCRADSQADALTRARCGRVADNTTGADDKSGASLLLDAALNTGLPWKWAYALFEAAIATITGLSLAYFLARLFTPAAAGLGLILLSFMTLLPPQGLHQFVGTTLAIALSLALWGAAIRRDTPAAYIAIAAGVAVTILIHPVALVYAGGFAILALYAFRLWLTVTRMALVAAILVGLLILLLALSNPVRDVFLETLSSHMWRVAVDNLTAMPQRFSTFAVQNAGFVAMLIVAVVLWWRRGADGWVVTTITALLLLALGTLFYRTNFFTFALPLDLFARVFIGIAAVGCGLIGTVLVTLWQSGATLKRITAVTAIAIVIVPSVLSWQRIFYDNINTRAEVIDERPIRSVLSKLSDDATLAYGELEISPMAVFAAGGGSHGAIPMMGLSSERRSLILEERRPAALVLPNFHVLNMLSVAGSRSLARRRYGFPASLISLIAVRTPGAPMTTLWLRVQNESDTPATLGPIRYVTDNGQQQILSNLTIASHFSGWLPIDIGAAFPARQVLLNLPPSALWITGVAINDPPRDNLAWPWNARATVGWQRRDMPQTSHAQGIVFSVPELMAYWNRQTRGPIALPKLRSVISDESGLVFVATDYSR